MQLQGGGVAQRAATHKRAAKHVRWPCACPDSATLVSEPRWDLKQAMQAHLGPELLLQHALHAAPQERVAAKRTRALHRSPCALSPSLLLLLLLLLPCCMGLATRRRTGRTLRAMAAATPAVASRAAIRCGHANGGTRTSEPAGAATSGKIGVLARRGLPVRLCAQAARSTQARVCRGVCTARAAGRGGGGVGAQEEHRSREHEKNRAQRRREGRESRGARGESRSEQGGKSRGEQGEEELPQGGHCKRAQSKEGGRHGCVQNEPTFVRTHPPTHTHTQTHTPTCMHPQSYKATCSLAGHLHGRAHTLPPSHSSQTHTTHIHTKPPAAWLGICVEARTPCRPDDSAARLCRIVMLRSFRRSRDPFSVSSVLRHTHMGRRVHAAWVSMPRHMHTHAKSPQCTSGPACLD